MDLCPLQTKFLLFRVSQTKDVINETLARSVFHEIKNMMAKLLFS